MHGGALTGNRRTRTTEQKPEPKPVATDEPDLTALIYIYKRNSRSHSHLPVALCAIKWFRLSLTDCDEVIGGGGAARGRSGAGGPYVEYVFWIVGVMYWRGGHECNFAGHVVQYRGTSH